MRLWNGARNIEWSRKYRTESFQTEQDGRIVPCSPVFFFSFACVIAAGKLVTSNVFLGTAMELSDLETFLPIQALDDLVAMYHIHSSKRSPCSYTLNGTCT